MIYKLNKKILLAIFFVLFFSLVFFPKETKGEADSQVVYSPYKISFTGWISKVPPMSLTKKVILNGMNETIYCFSDGGKRKFTFTNMEMPTGDNVYFIKYESDNLTEKDTPGVIVSLNDTFKNCFQVVHPERVSEIPINNVNLPTILRFEKTSVYIRPIETFYSLDHTMIDWNKTNNITPGVSIQNGNSSFNFLMKAAPKGFSYSWFILSNCGDLSGGECRKTSLTTFDKSQRLFPDGCYGITDDSYSPPALNGYWRNPANIPGNWMVDGETDATKMNKLEIDISYVIAAGAVENQRKDGTWSTSPKSNWLYSNYKIGYDYYDDRRNTDGVLFLARFDKLFNQPLVREAVKKYDKWLFSYAKTYGYKVQGGGILLPDYLAYGTKNASSHTALNHNLANINYCFETGGANLSKIALGQQILLGINNTDKKWVKSNCDLVYGLSKYFKPIPSIDYIYLTRDDLVRTIVLCKGLNINSSKIEKLLLEKNKWLKNSGY